LLKVVPSAEAGLINHNTTTEERESERDRERAGVSHTCTPIHEHTRPRRIEAVRKGSG
jgi:DNA-binding transcriptional regulator YiaG